MVELDVNCSNIHKETKAVSWSLGMAFLQRLLQPLSREASKNPRGEEKRRIFSSILLGSAKNQNWAWIFIVAFYALNIQSLFCLDQGENYPATKNNELTAAATPSCFRLFVRLVPKDFSSMCSQLFGRVNFLVCFLAYGHPEKHNGSQSCYNA